MGNLSSFSRMLNPVTAGLKRGQEAIREQASYARSRFCFGTANFRQGRDKMSRSLSSINHCRAAPYVIGMLSSQTDLTFVPIRGVLLDDVLARRVPVSFFWRYRVSLSSERNAVSKSSALMMNRFPSRCASVAISNAWLFR